VLYGGTGVGVGGVGGRHCRYLVISGAKQCGVMGIVLYQAQLQ